MLHKVHLTQPQDRPSLLDLDEHGLMSLVAGMGEQPYRGRQLFRWLHRACAPHFEVMTDLPRSFRARLAEQYGIRRGQVVQVIRSADGLTEKLLLRLPDGETIETVEMVAPNGKNGHDRRTVCVSTQVGCAVGCIFCATGKSGFGRNLRMGEILEQVYHFYARSGRRATNVVFMGMGEPLVNYDATVQAIRVLNAPGGYGLGARNITISTAGVEPRIRLLAQEGLQVGLAVSLHAPNDALRSQLVPLNRRYPIAAVLDAAFEYAHVTGRRVTFEYAMIAGVNDSPALAAELGNLLKGKLCHVNLIPMNPIGDGGLAPSPPSRVEAFRQTLVRAGIPCTVRRSRGQDIMAACGQLRRQVSDSIPVVDGVPREVKA